jgi:gluconate 5-dehydrogenase
MPAVAAAFVDAAESADKKQSLSPQVQKALSCEAESASAMLQVLCRIHVNAYNGILVLRSREGLPERGRCDIKELFRLDGRKAIVIGGGGDIGRAVAKGLAFYGAEVAIASRDEAKLNRSARLIEEEIGKTIHVMTADVSEESATERLAVDFLARFGKIDILVNAQGYNKKYPASEHPMDEWDRMFDVNIRSIMLCCKYFGRPMIAARYGRIVNISSFGAFRGKPTDNSVAYSSTKGAVDALTVALAGGWAQYGITVNAVGPIMTETEMMKPLFEQNPELRDGTAARVPMGRIGLPDDNIGPAIFFASDACGFVTGQILYPDGGIRTQQ